MSISTRSLLVLMILLCGVIRNVQAGDTVAESPKDRPLLAWMTDYAEARSQAIAQEQMLLIYFRDPKAGATSTAFEQKTLADLEADWSRKNYVLLRVPTTETITVDGKEQTLLGDPSFRAMNGRPGLAVIDFQNVNQPYYKRTVGCLPFQPTVYYASTFHEPKSVRTFLELPSGSLTQRMMIYAVRMHPEKPASTQGTVSEEFAVACRQHSRHQADIRLQGHHNWESRFHRIWQRTGGKQPTEVCAESWPGKSLVEACFDCVHSWRQSSGHWHAVRGKHPRYGYDIAQGSNGIWYATGIFGGKASPIKAVSGRNRRIVK